MMAWNALHNSLESHRVTMGTSILVHILRQSVLSDLSGVNGAA